MTAVVTFTEVFVGLVVAAGLCRAQLCRASEPLPTARLLGLLRAAELIAALIALTILTDFIAFALRADETEWEPATSWIALGLLAVALPLSASFVMQRRARQSICDDPTECDWASDIPHLLMLAGSKVPVLQRSCTLLARGFVRLIDGEHGLRQRPFAFTAGAATLMGAAIGGMLKVGEGTSGGLFLAEATVFAGGTFTFLVLANRVLRLVALPTVGLRMRVVWQTATAVAASLPPTLAFRDDLWRPLFGHGVRTAGELAELLLAAALISGLVSLAFGVARASRGARRRPRRVVEARGEDDRPPDAQR